MLIGSRAAAWSREMERRGREMEGVRKWVEKKATGFADRFDVEKGEGWQECFPIHNISPGAKD